MNFCQLFWFGFLLVHDFHFSIFTVSRHIYPSINNGYIKYLSDIKINAVHRYYFFKRTIQARPLVYNCFRFTLLDYCWCDYARLFSVFVFNLKSFRRTEKPTDGERYGFVHFCLNVLVFVWQIICVCLIMSIQNAKRVEAVELSMLSKTAVIQLVENAYYT